jgi:hypothetical protein
MTYDKKRMYILELCSESECGSWEFWSSRENKTDAECEQIFQALITLVRDGKIFPVEHATVIDQSYRPVPLDEARLKDELQRSMKPYNVDQNLFYWFLATEEGKEDDLSYRRRALDNS